MSAIVDALLAELDDAALDTLAERLAPRLAERLGQGKSTSWLDVTDAAEYLRCPTSRIYSLSSSRRIPLHRDGSRLLFKRDELDRWVRDGGATRS